MTIQETPVSLNGYGDEIPEDDATLLSVNARLKAQGRPDGTFTKLDKEQLSFLKTVLHIPRDADPKFVFLELLNRSDFKNENERNKHMRAFMEADKMGCDLTVNIAYLLSNGAINRGGHKTTTLALMVSALNHSTMRYLDERNDKQRSRHEDKSPIA